MDFSLARQRYIAGIYGRKGIVTCVGTPKKICFMCCSIALGREDSGGW
jgi:hypothetical protein